VRLFFAVEDRAREIPRYLVHDVALDRGLDELGMEQLAQVVYLSAMALWAGNVESSRRDVEEGLRPPLAAPPPTPTAPPTAPPLTIKPPQGWRHGIRVGLDYIVRFRGDEGLTEGPGASVGVLWSEGASELGGRLHAELSLPHHPAKSGVEIDVFGGTFRLGLTMGHRASNRIWVTGEVGPGLDVVRYQTSSIANRSLQPTPGALSIRPLSYASVGVRADLGFASLSCSALVAVQLVRTHYDISENGLRSELLVPWLVQPGFSASVSW
jgi:hypothetical protein